MATQRFSLRRGAPRDLELSWGFGYRNFTVKQRGRLLGTIASRAELGAGRTFTLDDKATLSVRLVGASWLAPELELLRNGVALPGSALDPFTRLSAASNAVFVVAGLSLLVALLRLGSDRDEAIGMAIFSALFLLLGFFTRRGSLAAAITALVLYLLDAIAGLATGVVAPGAIFVRGFLVLLLVRGILGIRELRRRGLLPTPEGRLWRVLAWVPALCALAGLSMLANAYLGGRGTDASTLFARVADSVVVVVRDGPGDDDSQGSGIVVGAGRVITNGHVVGQARQVKVFFGGREWPARVVYRDPTRDLAELKVDGLPATPAALRPQVPAVGERVYAVGAPQGLELTLSEGLVSSLRSVDDGSAPLIQTSAPISPGSSGGGLFDEAGRLVGWTTFQLAEGQNLNFAVPAGWLADFEKRQGMPGGLEFFREDERPAQAAVAAEPAPAGRPVLEILGAPWEQDQAAALEELAARQFVVHELAQALRSPEARHRTRAAEALAALPADRRGGGADPVVSALSDERDPAVMLALLNAARAFGAEGDVALGRLVLISRDPLLRREGVDALGRQGTQLAVQQLVRFLASEQDEDLRAAARVAIGPGGEIAARLLVGELATCPYRAEACVTLIDTLGDLGAAAKLAVPRLWELREGDGAIRAAADRAIARIDAAAGR